VADYTLQTGLPNLPLLPGMKLRLEAIDPTTGAAVTGVTATDWAIYANDESRPADETPAPVLLLRGP
jgi:hypothetical protein